MICESAAMVRRSDLKCGSPTHRFCPGPSHNELRGQRELTLGASGPQAVPRVALPGARKTSKGELSEREPMGERMENVHGNEMGTPAANMHAPGRSAVL